MASTISRNRPNPSLNRQFTLQIQMNFIFCKRFLKSRATRKTSRPRWSTTHSDDTGTSTGSVQKINWRRYYFLQTEHFRGWLQAEQKQHFRGWLQTEYDGLAQEENRRRLELVGCYNGVKTLQIKPRTIVVLALQPQIHGMVSKTPTHIGQHCTTRVHSSHCLATTNDYCRGHAHISATNSSSR